MRAAARAIATGPLSWDRVVEPLHALCLDPRPAPDQADAMLAWSLGRIFAPRCPTAGRLRRWRYQASYSLRCRGVLGTIRRALEVLPLPRASTR